MSEIKKLTKKQKNDMKELRKFIKNNTCFYTGLKVKVRSDKEYIIILSGVNPIISSRLLEALILKYEEMYFVNEGLVIW